MNDLVADASPLVYKMTQPAAASIRQLTSRLENATSAERLEALQELQTVSRSEAKAVGEHALQKVLDFLKEQGSSEEYQESLDLIDRLIKTRDSNAAIANTGIILSTIGNIELLLGRILSIFVLPVLVPVPSLQTCLITSSLFRHDTLCHDNKYFLPFLFNKTKLDLLEHEDFTVGLMTSQILTEVHAIDPLRLEECIQECPAGTLLFFCPIPM